MSKLLEKLNPAQLAAVEHDTGPMLIVAGAGTGKTHVLTSRLLYLVQERGVDPNQILILTFTEKAANELAERADIALPLGQTADWIKTFHGLGRSILSRHALDIGLPGDYKMIDSTAAWILVKKHLADFKFDYYKQLGNPNKYIADLLAHFSRLKDENISADAYLKFAAALKANNEADEVEIKRVQELAAAYQFYNQLLLDNRLIDYGDLITYSIKLLKDRPNILRAYQEQFKYIMVDEFQDTNFSQYELVKLLAGERQNLTVVGDDDQSIYKFRGASLSNILEFRRDYPSAQSVVLTENYRSGQVILDAAYRFITKNNPNRLEVQENLDKRLTSNSAQPGLVEHWNLPDTFSESSAVAMKIIDLQHAGQVNWSDIAVLFRANTAADRFVKEFSRLGIPYQYLSHRGLYYKPIVMELMSYLRLLDNYHESAAVFKVLSIPAFRLEHPDIIELSKMAREHHWSLFEALSQPLALQKISPTGQTTINKLTGLVAAHFEIVKTRPVTAVIAAIVRDVFYPHLDRDRHWPEFLLLNQIYAKAVQLEESIIDARLKDFVELIDLEMEAGDTGSMPAITDDADTVKLATAHSSKGLEFKYVFVVDLVDRRFPSDNHPEAISVNDGLITERLPEGNHHLEEERRLFYVAMTRAKEGLYLTSYRDGGGKNPKKPSKFIPEIEDLKTIDFDFSTTGTELDRAITRFDSPEPELTVYPTPDRFSFSALENYNNCPLQYKFSHILKLPIEKQGASSFGKMMHAVLNEFLTPLLVSEQFFNDKPVKASDLITLPELLAIYEKHWTPVGYDSKLAAEEHYHLGKKYCQNFVELLLANGLPKVLGLETSFSFSLGKFKLYGNIDRVDELPDGTLRVIDYKTGSPIDKVDYQKTKQLLLYKLGAEQKYGKIVSKLVYYYFQTNNWLEFEAKPKDLEKIQAEIVDSIKSIKACDFHPNPGKLCSYCDFRNICEFRK